ncbi:hypothetical protein RI129_009680 [Pyrocoelia pectoralis]|uniref:Regulator of microtubule dynamics protein 1 n=1 Tax=Pyrocoelia pectoralis TaxID=417401 RepID=A0AAN7V8V6_9COLE
MMSSRTKPFKQCNRNLVLQLQILSLLPFLKNCNPFCEKTCKSNRYWVRQSLPEVIEDADELFSNEKYMEVYELLNRLKFRDNPEDVRNEMITEGYEVIRTALELGANDANVHKWAAIIIDAKSGAEGTVSRIHSYDMVKIHLLKAAELNPNDVTIYYMLGRWCFTLSNMTWFQRKICCFLFATCPTSTYDEAQNYFVKAEKIKPRFYIPNLYMLGCTSFYLNDFSRARYYLSVASNITPRTRYETECVVAARKMNKPLLGVKLIQNASTEGNN